jgi:hypothetical protein
VHKADVELAASNAQASRAKRDRFSIEKASYRYPAPSINATKVRELKGQGLGAKTLKGLTIPAITCQK